MSSNNSASAVIALRYTFDAWSKTYPELGAAEWEDYNCPDNYVDYFAGILYENKEIEKQSAEDENFAFIQVVIDDEYFEWLENEEKENTSENRILYGLTLTKEDRIRLISKNKMDRSYTVLCIAISSIDENPKKEMNIKLSDLTKEKLITYLEKIYGKGRVFLPGYVVFQEDFVNVNYMFTNMAKIYFELGKVHEIEEFECQDNSSLYKLLELCIPVVICNNAAVSAFKPFDYAITEDHIPEAYQAPEEVFFTEEGLDEFGILGVEDFMGSELENMIKADIGLDSMIDPFLSDMSDVMERHDELVKTLEEKYKERK